MLPYKVVTGLPGSEEAEDEQGSGLNAAFALLTEPKLKAAYGSPHPT